MTGFTGGIGNGGEGDGVTGLALVFENGVRRRNGLAAAPSPDQGNRGKRRERDDGPCQALPLNQEARRTLQIIEIEPLRDAFGVANTPLILERFFFFGHLSISTKEPRGRR